MTYDMDFYMGSESQSEERKMEHVAWQRDDTNVNWLTKQVDFQPYFVPKWKFFLRQQTFSLDPGMSSVVTCAQV